MVHAMQTRGIQIDPTHFQKMEKVLKEDMERVSEEVRAIAGHYINLGSGPQVSHFLFKELGLKQARPKLTKTGDRESVEKEVLIAVQHEHEAVGKIIEFKEIEKLKGTYAEPIPRLAVRTAFGTWRLFPDFTTTRIPSGRFAAKNPNLLAMPNRTKRGRELCKGFITDPGWVLLSVDESQIEPRTVAHRSEDPKLLEIYFSKQDLYSDFAIGSFNIPDKRYEDAEGWHYPGVDKKEHRFPSKTCMLAAIYRVTGKGLVEQMPVICIHCGVEAKDHDRDVCSRFQAKWHESNCTDIINSFYLRYRRIGPMQKMDDARARKFGYVWDDWGRMLHVTAVKSVHEWVQSAALREAGNMPIQCLPAETMILSDKGYTQIGDFHQGSVWTGERMAPAKRVDKGVGELVRVKIDDGSHFICDTAHKMLVARGPWSEWASVLDLNPDDHLPSSLVEVSGGSPVEDPEFWYWVGRYYGDGHITKGRSNPGVAIAFGVHESSRAERFRDYVQSRGHSKPRIDTRWKRGGRSSLLVTSHTFHKEMMDEGVKPNEYSWSKRLPRFAFQLDGIRRKQLVQGYYDADGNGPPKYYEAKRMWTQQQLTSVNLQLLQDTQLMYRSLGIYTRIMGPYSNKDGHRDFYRLIVNSEPRLRRVVSVERLSISAKVYTLSVDDHRHAFDSEGVISKNSFACGTLKLTMSQVQHELTKAKYYGNVWYPLLPVHDEILSECREDVAGEIGEHIAYTFKHCVELKVPLAAEYSHAPNWGSIIK